MNRTLAIIAGALIGSALSASASVVMVQWGENPKVNTIVNGDIGFASSPTTFDNTGAYQSPGSYYINPTGRSPDFFFASARDITGSANQSVGGIVDNETAADRIRVQTTQSGALLAVRSMVMWKSDDFLGTGGALTSMTYNISISTASGSGNNHDAHFLIQTADLNYYASDDLQQGTKTLSTESANWYEFNPLNAGVASVGASVGTIDMSADNIIGVGYYVESRSNPATTMRHYTYFFQTIHADPPKGTVVSIK